MKVLLQSLIGLLVLSPAVVHAESSQKANLGNILFHDATLSNPPGQSCATCHQAARAFSEAKVVSEGAVEGVKGSRNAPALLYAKYSPAFNYVDWQKTWAGGQFWDGRVDSLKEQAPKPLLNPMEMNNTEQGLAKKLRQASYYEKLVALYGESIKQSDQALIDAAADALQAFQMSDTFAPFTSKWDYAQQGLIELSEQEKLGHKLWNGKAACIDCHSGIYDNKQVYTQFVHHNILTPRNPELPFYQQDKSVNPDGADFVDLGTAQHPDLNAEQRQRARGRFKTPTLRNVAVTAPYMHNGVFDTLREVVEYYNDVEDRERWGPPEVAENQSNMLRTQLSLTEQEISALIAFMEALTDGYQLPEAAKQELSQSSAP